MAVPSESYLSILWSKSINVVILAPKVPLHMDIAGWASVYAYSILNPPKLWPNSWTTTG